MSRKTSRMEQADFSRALALEVRMIEFQQTLRVKGARIACNMQKMRQSLHKRKTASVCSGRRVMR